MDLNYGPRYDSFRTKVRSFLAEHGDQAPKPPRLKDPATLAWQRLLIGQGYAARTIPAAYGGFGAKPDILESRIIAEEFAAAGVPGGLGGQGIAMFVPTLLEVGSEAQRQRWIGPTLRGEVIWCQGYSEPDAGSDLASLRTSAVIDGDHFVVNGQKIWTSTAMEADMMFCLVRTEPDAPKHQGISYLLIPMDTPGIEVRPLQQMTGDAGFNEVFLTDVRVPLDQIVGARGEGWMVANATLNYERGSLGDPNATMSRLLRLLRNMAEETVDGVRILDQPVFRDRLLRLQARVESMRLNELRLLSSAINPGEDDVTLARLVVKLQGTELRHDLEGLGIDALGEFGLLYDHSPHLRDGGSWQAMYMFFLGLIIGGGTSQIQKNIISERGLGMPREPKPAAAAATSAPASTY